MKIILIALTVFGSSSAFAWQPTCPTNGSSDFAAVSSNALAVKKHIVDDSGGALYFSAKSEQEAKSLAKYAPWLLDQLNQDSLLFAEFVNTLDGMNARESSNNYASLIDANGQPCRRQKFAAKDLRFVSGQLSGTELTLRFQVVSRFDSRWSSTTYGEEFEMKLKATFDKTMKQFDIGLLEYPAFVREVSLKVENF